MPETDREPSGHFTFLLITLIATLLLMPGLPYLKHPLLVKVGLNTLLSLVVVSGTLAIAGRGRLLLVAVALALPDLVMNGVQASWPDPPLWADLLDLGTSLLFVSFLVVVIFRHLFRPQRVTGDTIMASLCVYLLLGVSFAYLYGIVELSAPGSIDLGDRSDLGGSDFHVLVYYSFVTLTTLGYGDILPVAPFARMLSIVEAFLGPVYLAVLVARLVGIELAQSRGEAGRDERDR